MVTSIALANLPDIDIVAGLMLHQDMWKLHRRATHTPQFALLTGALAGALGLISVRADGCQRRVLPDALTGALIGGSHILADSIPHVRLSKHSLVPRVLRRKVAGMSLANWLAGGIECFAMASAISRTSTPDPYAADRQPLVENDWRR